MPHLLEALRTGRSGSIALVVPHVAIWAGVSNARRMWFHGITSPVLVQPRACPGEWGLGLWGATGQQQATSFGARWAPSLGSSWGIMRAAPGCESAQLRVDGSVLWQDPSHLPPPRAQRPGGDVPVSLQWCLEGCDVRWGREDQISLSANPLFEKTIKKAPF